MEDKRVILRTCQAAEYIGIKKNTLEIWRSKKKGPKFHKIGRNVIYFQDDLDAYIASQGVHTIDSVNLKKLH